MPTEHPRWLRWILTRAPRWGTPRRAAVLAVMLSLPALWAGWAGDDHFHRLVLQGLAGDRDPILELFTFLDGGARNAELMDMGVLPWTSLADMKMRFLRPVSAATHVMDHALWPNVAWVQHAHSLAWLAAAVAVVAVLLRRLVVGGALAVAVAVLAFAVEDALAIPGGWIANRNALVALVGGGLAVLAHLRWRDTDRWTWAPLSAGLLGAALLAGESALGAAIWIGAVQLTLDRGGWARRLTGLVPAAATVVAWRIAYQTLGYGARGSGLYLDPGTEPVRFGVAVLERWPTLFLAWWGQVPIDGWGLLAGPGRVAVALAGVGLAAGVGWMLLPLLRERAEARCLALGGALCLVPVCATMPMDRLLTWAAVGSAGLVGLLATALPPGRRRAWALALLALHLPVSAALRLARSLTLPVWSIVFGTGALHAPDDAALADQSLMFVNSTDFAVVYTMVQRQAGGDRVVPRRVVRLGPQHATVHITRTDSTTLELAVDGGFLSRPVDTLLRDAGVPFSVGERIARPDFVAMVLAVTEDGRPRRVQFAFEAPLESPAYRWVAFTDQGLVEWVPPGVGGSTDVVPALPAF